MNRMQLIELSVYSMYRVYTIESIGYRGLQYLTHGENETRRSPVQYPMNIIQSYEWKT